MAVAAVTGPEGTCNVQRPAVAEIAPGKPPVAGGLPMGWKYAPCILLRNVRPSPGHRHVACSCSCDCRREVSAALRTRKQRRQLGRAVAAHNTRAVDQHRGAARSQLCRQLGPHSRGGHNCFDGVLDPAGANASKRGLGEDSIRVRDPQKNCRVPTLARGGALLSLFTPRGQCQNAFLRCTAHAMWQHRS